MRVTELKHIIQLAPSNRRAWPLLIREYYEMEKFEEAKTCISKIKNLEPEDDAEYITYREELEEYLECYYP